MRTSEGTPQAGSNLGRPPPTSSCSLSAQSQVSHAPYPHRKTGKARRERVLAMARWMLPSLIALISGPSSQVPERAATAPEPAEKPIQRPALPQETRWAAMELHCLWPIAMPVAIPNADRPLILGCRTSGRDQSLFPQHAHAPAISLGFLRLLCFVPPRQKQHLRTEWLAGNREPRN